MGFRYRKSIKVGSTRLNLSKSGVGCSFGTKGFRVTKKAGGGTRTTASIPGTGISFVKDSHKQSGNTVKTCNYGSGNILNSPSDRSSKNSNPLLDFAIAFLIWLGIWFASLLAMIIISTVLFKDREMSALFAFIALILPVILASKVVADRRKKKKDAAANSVAEPTESIESDKEEESVHVEKEIIERAPAIEKDCVCDYTEKTYHVAGTTYHEDAIIRLSSENQDYKMSKRDLIDSGMTDEKIWEYEFEPSNVQLVPDPENPHDQNAVKVIVDGEHVGYIKKGSCKHILKLLQEDLILKIDCKIGGGKYKIVREEYDDEKDQDVYIIERDSTNFFVALTIREKYGK